MHLTHNMLCDSLFKVWVSSVKAFFWKQQSTSHLHHLYLLVAAVPRDEPAVFTSRHQRAIPQHAQSKDAALVGSLDDVADAISACATEMGWDGWESSVAESQT